MERHQNICYLFDMPELPEVETVLRSLQPILQGKTIKQLALSKYSLRQPIRIEKAEDLMGKTFQKLNRFGKYLCFSFEDQSTLLCHLGMSGRFLYSNAPIPLQKHTHVTIQFTDQSEIQYIDPRRFGFITFYQANERIPEIDKLGFDPFDVQFTATLFIQKLRSSTRELKTWLLDQKNIAGLGNIYVAEALFDAKLHPQRMTSHLSIEESLCLYSSIQKVLRAGIQNRGTTLSDGGYVDALGQPGTHQSDIHVYGRKDQPCFICNSLIKQQKQAQRSTYFCPTCQR